jgi:hypothetical protein
MTIKVFFMMVLFVALHNSNSFAQAKKEYLITNYGAVGDGKTINFLLKDDEFRPALVFDDVTGINLEKVTFPNNLQSNQVILKNAHAFKRAPNNDKQVMKID